MEKMEAINQICRAWGVSDEKKLDAIGFMFRGADCQKVVKAITDISVSLGALESLRPERTA